MCPLNQIAHIGAVVNGFDLAVLDIKHNIDHVHFM